MVKRTYRGHVWLRHDVCILDFVPGMRHYDKVKVLLVTRGGRDIHIQHEDLSKGNAIVHASRLSPLSVLRPAPEWGNTRNLKG
jgi:hypothetical protein